MARLIREKDWSLTSLGDPVTWPLSLKTLLQTMLPSRFPMFLWWGPELICFYNDAYLPSLGNPGKHPVILGVPAKDAWMEIWDTIKPLMDTVMETGEGIWREDQLIPIFRNGSIEDVYWTFSYSPVCNDEGVRSGILVVCHETTEKVLNQKKLEETGNELLKKGEYLRNLIVQAPVAMCLFTGPQYIVEVANDRMLSLWGKQAEQVMQQPLFKGLSELRMQGLEDLLQHVFTSGEPVTATERLVKLPRDHGLQEFYIDFTYAAIKEGGGTIRSIAAVAVDVTEKVINRKKIEDSEERARIAAEASNLGTFDFDFMSGNTITSPQFNKIFDLPEGTVHENYIARICADDQPVRRKAMGEAIISGRLFYEVRIVRQDGTLHWIRAHGKVLFKEDHTPSRILGTVQDITELREAEQKREEYIAIASHELRNPLTTLHMAIELSVQATDASQKDLLLQKAKKQVNRLMTLTNELLNVSKMAAGILEIKKEPIGLDGLIADCTAHFGMVHPAPQFAVTGSRGADLIADRIRIEQVLINLISNAIKYSPAASVIQIEVLDNPRSVRVAVRDHGIGIDADKIGDVFKKFMRIDNGGKAGGYGLGLYISEQIIRQHGGKMGAESEKGKGSEFWFELPHH